MPSTGLHGPYSLTVQNIDAVARGKVPGAYALGHRNDKNVFIVEYVGRSDDDVNGRLKKSVRNQVSRVQSGYFNTAKQAFDRECRIFHDFGGTASLANEIHPARPKGSDWKCPHCNTVG